MIATTSPCAGLTDQRLQGAQLVGVLGGDLGAGVRRPFADQVPELGHRPASQVFALVRDLDDVGAEPGQLAEP